MNDSVTNKDIQEIERIKRKKMKELIEKLRRDKTAIKIEVNDRNFEERVIEQSKRIPVLVDFWATWCMPCLILSPVVEKLAEEYKGEFVLAKMNVDENPITSQRYGITSIPCVKLFKNGRVVDEFVGALPEQRVKEWINKNLVAKDEN